MIVIAFLHIDVQMKLFSLRTLSTHMFIEVFSRGVLLLLFIVLEQAPPFERRVLQEEFWLYRNPIAKVDTVPTWMLFSIAICVPLAFIVSNYYATRDKTDLIQAILCFSLTALMTGNILNVLKLSVGRPRPDFFYRCFPDGVLTDDFHCTGEEEIIKEGRKSFPSGHAGWMFACFGFLSLYLCAKFQCCRPAGRSQGWRLCAVITPLIAACVVSITRLQDHRHHTEDILCGGVIGILCAMLCYHHYYPPLFHFNCHSPYEPNDPESGLNTKSSSVIMS